MALLNLCEVAKSSDCVLIIGNEAVLDRLIFYASDLKQYFSIENIELWTEDFCVFSTKKITEVA